MDPRLTLSNIFLWGVYGDCASKLTMGGRLSAGAGLFPALSGLAGKLLGRKQGELGQAVGEVGRGTNLPAH
jgi:hypothetical protein